MRVVGECFFWYRLTRVFPDKFHRAVKRLCCVCVVDRYLNMACSLHCIIAIDLFCYQFVLLLCLFAVTYLLSRVLILLVFSVLLATLLWLLLWHQKQTGCWFQSGRQKEDGRRFFATNWLRCVILDSLLYLPGTEWMNEWVSQWRI